MADRIVVRLHYGERLDEVLAADPELPCRPTLRRWRRERPEFDRVLRLVLAAWRSRRVGARRCTPEFAEYVIERILQGASLNSLSREAGMPARATFRRWMAVRPDFADAVERACEEREDWYSDQILAIAESATPETSAAARRRIGNLKQQLGRLRNRPGRPRASSPREA